MIFFKIGFCFVFFQMCFTALFLLCLLRMSSVPSVRFEPLSLYFLVAMLWCYSYMYRGLRFPPHGLTWTIFISNISSAGSSDLFIRCGEWTFWNLRSVTHSFQWQPVAPRQGWKEHERGNYPGGSALTEDAACSHGWACPSTAQQSTLRGWVLSLGPLSFSCVI